VDCCKEFPIAANVAVMSKDVENEILKILMNGMFTLVAT